MLPPLLVCLGTRGRRFEPAVDVADPDLTGRMLDQPVTELSAAR
ncbi:hypothetical protein [Streptosporangium sp. NPDC049644]